MVTLPALLSARPLQLILVAGFALATLVIQKGFRLLIERQRQVHEKAAQVLSGPGVRVTLTSDGSITVGDNGTSPQDGVESRGNAQVLSLPPGLHQQGS
jgi:hypothetical protein